MSNRPSFSPQWSPAEASVSRASSSVPERPRGKRRRSMSPPLSFSPSTIPVGTVPLVLSPSTYNPPRSLANLLRSPSPPAQPRRTPYSDIGAAVSEEEDSDDDNALRASGASSESGELAITATGGDWTYHLEILQQPQRARACGFGDKDRRPLSPPPILRLWVRQAGGETVEASRVNIHFLVLLVDLWSADGQEARNVVMHPSTQQGGRGPSPRPGFTDPPEVPSGPGPSSRPSTASSRFDSGHSAAWSGGAWRAPVHYSPFQISPGLSPLGRAPGQEYYSMPSPLPVPSPTITGWTPPSPPRPLFSRTQSYTPRFAPQLPDLARPVTAPSRSLPQPDLSLFRSSPSRSFPNLPSLSSITEQREEPPSRSIGSSLTLPALQQRNRLSTASSSSRPSWSTQTPPSEGDRIVGARPSSLSIHPSSMSPLESPRNPRPSSSWSDRPRSSGQYSPGRPTSSDEGSSGNRATRGRSPFFAGGPTTPLDEHSYYPPSESSVGYPRTPEQPRLQLPSASANYSRVLVGTLCSICQRLQDEEGNQGLFFFAHDLGVRTEGTFTLKFTLVNLNSMMFTAAVPGDRSRVLTEVFSTPFTVYSAKRFPGVIPTTDLTRLFAQQNVRLPTRQKRAREESPADVESGDGEDDESSALVP